MNGINFKLKRRELYIEIPRGTSSDTLDPASLEKAFRSSEYNNYFVSDETWANLARNFMLESGESTAPLISIRIGEQRPAQLSLRLSDDKMEVEAIVEAPYSGTSLVTEQVLNQLRNAGIVNGIRRRAIEAVVAHSREAPPGASLTVLIAKGKAAVDGTDTWFKKLVEDARMRILKPQPKDKHRVDMRDFGALVSVKEGTAILQRIPFTTGISGYTVTGEAINAKDGKDKPLKAGIGTAIDIDNPDILVATVDGLPTFIDNLANVDDTLTLKGVDISTGHIDYDGSIIIDGNVTPGMRVSATGDITVNGYVDSAIIRAEGNITVTKGVIGRHTETDNDDEHGLIEHSTRIISDASIWVAYCQYATLSALHGVHIERQLTHCKVISADKIHVGGEGKAAAGKVIGGNIEIVDDLFVGQLGAPAGTKTRIHFNVPLQSEEYLAAVDEATKALKELVLTKRKLLKAKEAFLANPDSFNVDFRHTLKKLFDNTKQQISTARSKLLSLRDNEPPHPTVRVHINKVMHLGAEFIFHDKITRFHEPRGPCTVILREGKVEIES